MHTPIHILLLCEMDGGSNQLSGIQEKIMNMFENAQNKSRTYRCEAKASMRIDSIARVQTTDITEHKVKYLI